MLNKQSKGIILSIATAGILLVGCGGDSTDNEATSDTYTGYFIDAAVKGAHYKTTSGLEGDTDRYGRFSYRKGDKVEFSLGKVVLGECEPENDGKVTPKTLIAQRQAAQDGQEASITLMLQFLQALDSDGDASNGITIPRSTIEKFNTLSKEIAFLDINESELIKLDSETLDTDYDGRIDVDAQRAKLHFEKSEQEFDNGNRPDKNVGDGQGNGNGQGGTGEEQDHGKAFNLDDHEKSESLTQELKDSLSHMGNEERLAYDLYTNLYSYHKEKGEEIKQFYNISHNAEVKHIKTVQDLVKRYDLSASDFTNVNESIVNKNGLSASHMVSGVYDIQKIQDLYDDLYSLGKTSKVNALKVGCMVEVTDVNDLDKYIAQAEASNATDIVEAFKVLRNGSYNHYWAFDKALKNSGVANGCYFEGDALLTNKEGIYPKNEKGHGHGGN